MSKRRIVFYLSLACLFLALAGIPSRSQLSGQNGTQLGLLAGRNVNMVSGITWPGGDPYLQRQNEPSIAVSTRNPLHLLAGANDYRTIDIPFADEIPNQDAPSYVKDAWLGKFTSIDGGQTWKSTLLPGYPQDESTEGTNSPIYGLGAASDPVVRSGPNGIFYYAGMAFDRLNRPSGVMFISRYIDNNYKENVDTIDYIDTKIIDSGGPGQFIDKPWIAVDLPVDGLTIDFPAPGSTTQKVARHNVYAVYTVFLGTDKFTTATKIFFSRSTDNGATWSKPLKLTESQVINQGATIAVDPRGNGTIYVAWRRFGFPSQRDAIVFVKSKDRGKTFTKPVVVYEFAASTIQQPSKDGTFDQVTTGDSFRTNDYPTMAVDNNGRAFIAWSQRGYGPNSAEGLGESRIMISASYDGGLTWSAPPTEAINAQGWDDYRPGHQFMPSLTYAAGKLTLLWYDQRWDLCVAFNDPFIRDAYAQRHTIDVRLSQLPVDNDLGSLIFLNSIQVSRYPFVLFPDDPENPSSWTALQMLYNMPNLPMFQLGSVPFMGDYIDIAASPQIIYDRSKSKWVYNTDTNTPTVYHAVWTDNRDVLPAGEDFPGGDLSSGNFPLYNAPGSSCIDGSKTGLLNQNIYTSRISKGVIAGSPGNSKPLNFLRSFVIFVKNTTGTERQLDLQIMTDGAFFYDPGYPGVKPTVAHVIAYPYSYAQKTILVDSRTDEHASIKVNVSEGGNLISVIALNPDPTNPPIDESEGVDPDNPRIRNDGETHTPRIRNYQIVDWNYEEANPNITTVYPASYEDNANTDGVTPYPVEDDEQGNPRIRNPRIRNPRIRNNILNPRIRNESFGDDGVIPDDSHLTDIYWTIDNAGNTTSSFDLQTFETPTDIPDGVMVQVIIFKAYGTPTAEGCDLVEEEHQEVILNYEAPRIRNVSLLPEMTVDLKPNEKCHVLYRFYNPMDTTEQEDYYENHEELLADVVPDITPDVPPTDPDNNDVLDPGGPEQPVGELLILPQVLPDGVINQTYTASLQAQGGTPPYTWSGTLPDGLQVDSSSGQILGEPSVEAGSYSFDVTVQDSATPDPNTMTRTFMIRVSEPLTITTTTLPFGIVNTSYSASVEATGGFAPYTWSLSLGALPPGLDLASDTGVISGTPSSTGTYSFTIEVSDQSNPQQSSQTSLSITVSLASTLSSVYIYQTDMTSANSFKDTLEAKGIATDLLHVDGINSFDFSGYSIVLIGNDTGNPDRSWAGVSVYQDDPRVIKIVRTGLPIIAIGVGNLFFDAKNLKINIGWLSSAEDQFQTSILKVDPGHAIWNSPHVIGGTTVDIYQTPGYRDELWQGNVVPGVVTLAQCPGEPEYFPIVSQDRFLKWGFYLSPDSWTQTGKDLFENVVTWCAGLNGVGQYIDTWDTPGDLAGWVPNTSNVTLSVVDTGGNPGGYLTSDDNSGGYAGAYTEKTQFKQSLDPTTTFSVDLKVLSGLENIGHIYLRFRYKDSGYNGWIFELGKPALMDEWDTYTIMFNPNWTDAEAIAAGWVQEPTSASFTATMHDIYTTEVRFVGGEMLVGIDNFMVRR